MRLNEVNYDDSKPVDGYGPGFFRIDGQVHEGGVLVTHSGVAPWGGYADADALLALKDAVDVIFIGTGAEIATRARASGLVKAKKPCSSEPASPSCHAGCNSIARTRTPQWIHQDSGDAQET